MLIMHKYNRVTKQEKKICQITKTEVKIFLWLTFLTLPYLL